MVQKYQNSGRQILKGDRRGRGIHRRRNKRSNRAIRERIKKKRKGATLEGENICS